MANSKYEYVKQFEHQDGLLPSTYIVVRIDGRGFHRFSKFHKFRKPNDERALNLMNEAAKAVMTELPDIRIAYGESDEYSFVFFPDCTLFERRASKLISTVVSTFTSSYLYHWPSHFPDKTLSTPLPTFDARAIVYPNLDILKDYLNWRQVDCHINNLYNTTFWALVQRGELDARQAEEKLKGTVSADKNEILFSEFGINYNDEDAMFRKGSILFRQDFKEEAPAEHGAIAPAEKKAQPKRRHKKSKEPMPIVLEHVDMIKQRFWDERPWLVE